MKNTDIETKFVELRNAKVTLFNIGEEELKAREDLKKAESAIILQYAANPKDLGGNEAARAASIRDMTAKEHAALEKIETEKRNAQLSYDLAVSACDCMKWQLRNDQIAADFIAMGYTDW